jgi:sugar-specific transcriptional regulator TrmB
MALGLSRFQAVLYMTSLKHGILSVLELARLTGLNRPQIYEEAQRLVELGLYEVTGKQRRKYVPANPAKLMRLGKTRLTEAEEMLAKVTALVPELEAISMPPKNKVSVRYYEGAQKVRQAFEDQLEAFKNTEGISFAGSLEEVYAHIPEASWEKWDKQLAKQNSFYRLLTHNSEAGKRMVVMDKVYKRETRWIENFPIKSNIEVFNNVVLIVSFADELAVWIESQILADSLRTIFNALWDQSRRFE